MPSNDLTEIELLRESRKALKDDQEIKGGIIIRLTQQIVDLQGEVERMKAEKALAMKALEDYSAISRKAFLDLGGKE